MGAADLARALPVVVPRDHLGGVVYIAARELSGPREVGEGPPPFQGGAGDPEVGAELVRAPYLRRHLEAQRGPCVAVLESHRPPPLSRSPRLNGVVQEGRERNAVCSVRQVARRVQMLSGS